MTTTTTTTTARTTSQTTSPGTTRISTTTRTTTPGTTSRTTSPGVVTTSSRTTTPAVTTTRVSTTSGAVISGNPFVGVQPFANPYYASEILSLAIPSLPASLHAAASAVAKVPTFAWLDTRAKVEPLLGGNLAAIRALNQAGANPPIAGQFVVYDLPERDCAAAASNGELSLANNGLALYRQYIDSIRAKLIEYSDIKVILVIEPDSLANLVTNLNVPKCANAKDAYIQSTDYAVEQLNLPNVSAYLDGGHGGWLGWPANLPGAVTLFSDIYKNAGSPASLRGLAVNVANYNGWSLSTAPSYTTPNPNFDEKRYINAIGPQLAAAGFPARFIVDTGRNGVQPTAQLQQGDWCNVIGTGFGVRPTTNTGDALVDSFVWIKPGGESDGTSDTSAVRYDYHCGLADALKPAPEAGSWFQAYFEQLLRNANPAFP